MKTSAASEGWSERQWRQMDEWSGKLVELASQNGQLKLKVGDIKQCMLQARIVAQFNECNACYTP
jgi:hypothetical protein